MLSNLLNILGDWNPQLLREIKGRFRILPLIVAISVSLITQFVVFSYYVQHYPGENYPRDEIYCNSPKTYSQLSSQLRTQYNLTHQQLQKQFAFYTKQENYDLSKVQEIKKQIAVNQEKYNRESSELYYCPQNLLKIQQWWSDTSGDIFQVLNQIFIYYALAGGVYLLINDLAKEESRGTLNFIRLSPQSSTTILLGKLLGVPSLLYLGISLAVPLQIWAGLNSQVAFSSILGFDILLLFSCAFYYSSALLFALITRPLNGFQPWLGAGTVFGYLVMTASNSTYTTSDYPPGAFMYVLNPYYLIPGIDRSRVFGNFGWFNLNLSSSELNLAAFVCSIFFVLSCFVWLGLRRCFCNQYATILSKKQSYLLTSYCALLTLGSVNCQAILSVNESTTVIQGNAAHLMILHLPLFLFLIAAVTPQRQALLDWARYRRTSSGKSLWNNSLLLDLIWHEKSPAILAIAINAIIASTAISSVPLFSHIDNLSKVHALFGLVLAVTLAILYAAIVQIMLFMQTTNRALWALGGLSSAIAVPTIVVLTLFMRTGVNGYDPLLFTIAAPMAPILSTQGVSLSVSILAIFSYWNILAVLTFTFSRRLEKAGESATKALLMG